MREIRNADHNLVCTLDEQSGVIIIKRKDCETRIIRKPDGTYQIINKKSAV